MALGRSIIALLLAASSYAVPNGLFRFDSQDGGLSLRHCDYQAFATPYELNSQDFQWYVVPANNQNASLVSVESVNYPGMYLTIVSGTFAESGRLGIVSSPDPDDSSFFAAESATNSSLYTLVSASANSAFNGKYVSRFTQLSGGCAGSYAAPSGDVYLSDGSDSEATLWQLNGAAFGNVNVTIDAGNVTGELNPYTLGCHSDSGWAHQPRGFFAQMVFGQSFEEPFFPAWNKYSADNFSVTTQIDNATQFNNFPSMQFTYQSGEGQGWAGLANRGLGNEGLYFEAGKPYEGYVYISADSPQQAVVAIVDYTSSTILASVVIEVAGASQFQRYNFSFTPNANTTCEGIPFGSDPNIDCGQQNSPAHVCVRCGGQFAVGLASTGTINVGFVYLQPGKWARYEDTPVLQSVVDLLRFMGTNILRQGGTFSQTLYWKQWRGDLVQRPTMQFNWGADIVAGWGPFDMVDLLNSLGIEPVITLAEDQPEGDWPDLIEYCWGNESTTWGAQRFADGHPEPYEVSIFELGNEQYNPNFVQQVADIEARATSLGKPNFIRYMFPTNQGLTADDAQKAMQMGLPIHNIMPDIHIAAGGAVEVAEADFAALPDFNQRAINCETNAGTHDLGRALAEAADFIDWFTVDPAIGKRLFGRTASFCNARSGHYDGFDQGLTHFLPNMTWIQPPGYVHAMIAQTWGGSAVSVTSDNALPSVVAVSADTGSNQLVVRIVNQSPVMVNATFNIENFQPASTVTVWTLSSALASDENTPAYPEYVAPVKSQMEWPQDGTVTVNGNSFTIFVIPAASA